MTKIKWSPDKSFHIMSDEEIKLDQAHKRLMEKRNMVREWQGEKLIWRKKTFKEIWGERLSILIAWIIFPFYHTYNFLDKILYNFFHPRTNERWNGVVGPGGHTSYERNFSWGKLSFIIVVLFILIYFVFLR